MTLSKQHIINSLLDNHYLKKAKPYYLSMGNFTDKQWLKIKSFIVDTNNYLNKVHSFFNRLYKELLSGFCLVDNFPNHFSFYIVNQKNIKNMNVYIWLLDKLFEDYSLNLNTVLIISDASIKNNVAISVLYIYFNYSTLLKTIHHIINVTSTKTELFVIKCRINQTIQVPNTEHIIVITNVIHTARYIFDSSFYPY